MQLIECPWCGPREEIEFSYGGEAHVPYPAEPAALDDTEWAHYVFFRSNPKGLFAERWVHSVGCRRWFNAVRDTVTYRFAAVYPIGGAVPALATGEAAASDAPDSTPVPAAELESAAR
ncbi:sarcosine oxidase subunit delta [Microbacterium trichothecenolyticum]|uniref:Sarcosine oxidase subunit delta n=1 Tax=Microbacterium ureisolvens TaxID=2781186 RepID=A0ABS7I290_9MICO|nr:MULTISPECIES: sarcosine oxidase subunit delta [Microbacterium]MBW9111438.1 sarcosine oxidase subunit delta [Microbacterium ureisolvens]MBW9121686.1 sarcosine oxidase subunit delta [Microbacterium trichothecenolyticum]